jgi:putative heme-binding domain-containing protein
MKTLLLLLVLGLAAFTNAAEPTLTDAQKAELIKTLQDDSLGVQDRDSAARTLAQSMAGANAMIALAEKDELSEEMKPSAAYALAVSENPEIRKLGAAKLPMPKSKDGKAIPPIPELLEMKGDAANGAKVYANTAGANCVSCHIMGDKGRDIGPPLNTIGEKGKDILFESIVLPSVAIQHGFHSYLVKTKSSGTKMGILVDDNDEKTTLKDSNGEYIEIPAKDIVKKIEQKMSLMPQGLIGTMTVQELVDLIEYLSQQKVQQ